MRQGFIFNYRLCVNCKACSAACMLENGWQFAARRIFTHNIEAFDPGPVISISMACNHCINPPCMNGCPTSAYFKDEGSGAVIIDPMRCIGCKYCMWNCPYDAPKYNSAIRKVEKCHFCHQLLDKGSAPACSTACPTGALGFGIIPETVSLQEVGIVPEKGINPAYCFSGRIDNNKPEIIPALSPKRVMPELAKERNSDTGESSLVLFSFLSTLSVSLTISDFFSGKSYHFFYSLIAVLLAVLSSLFHLGSRLNAWRAVSNIRNSLLSREILALLIYGGFLVAAPFEDLAFFRVLLSLSGLILLIIIDSVYSYSAEKTSRFHSGQVFITSLLMVSFFSLQVLPFLFMAFLKLMIIFGSGQMIGKERTGFGIRFLRISLLLISMAVIVTGTGAGEAFSVMIFLTGELIDRYLFYTDFVPLNIIRTINKPIKISSDEKESD